MAASVGFAAGALLETSIPAPLPALELVASGPEESFGSGGEVPESGSETDA